MSEFASKSFYPAELHEAQRVAIGAARSVGRILLENWGNADYTSKNDTGGSWVTKWDTWAQGVIIDGLRAFDQEISFVAEEEGVTTEQPIYWTVDPIDGTTHFVRRNPFCSTMVSLIDHGVPVVAVIHDFVLNTTYYAASGTGAHRKVAEESSQRLGVSTRDIGQSILEIYTDEDSEEGMGLMRSVRSVGARLLRLSAAGHSLAAVARGGIEGFVSLNKGCGAVWDIAPGALLVHEAGGIVRSVDATSFDLKAPNFIAANPRVHSELKLAINRF